MLHDAPETFFLKRKAKVALSPLSESEAVTYGVGTGAGETIRIIERGGEERLLYSGYELRRRDCE